MSSLRTTSNYFIQRWPNLPFWLISSWWGFWQLGRCWSQTFFWTFEIFFQQLDTTIQSSDFWFSLKGLMNRSERNRQRQNYNSVLELIFSERKRFEGSSRSITKFACGMLEGIRFPFNIVVSQPCVVLLTQVCEAWWLSNENTNDDDDKFIMHQIILLTHHRWCQEIMNITQRP